MFLRFRYLFIFLLFSLGFSLSLLGSSEPFRINSIDYFTDYQGEFNIHEIQNKDFKPLSGALLGFNSSYYWFKVDINLLSRSRNVALMLNETAVDFIEVYSGEKLMYSRSEGIWFNPVVKGMLLNGEPIYLKIKFHNQVFFDLQLVDSTKIREKENLNLFSNGWYYGFVFMVFVVNLFFYFSLKNEPFLSYALFVASINLGISFFDGMLELWFGSVQIEAIIPLIHFLIGLTGFWFATGFLNLNQLFPKAKYVGYGTLLVSAISYTTFMVSQSFLFIAVADLLVFLLLMFYWVMGIVVVRKQEFAIFFVVGYVLVLLAGFFHVVPMNFGLHLFPFPIEIVKVGAVFEMLILTYAITYKVKIMQEENSSMKDELKNYIAKLLSFEERLSLDDSNTNPGEAVSNKIKKLATEFDLTDREVDVLLCIANQSTNSKIAEELFISVNTVKYHTRNIYQKLNINSKGDAISLLSNPI